MNITDNFSQYIEFQLVLSELKERGNRVNIKVTNLGETLITNWGCGQKLGLFYHKFI